MPISKNISQYVVFSEDSLSFALHKITDNRFGFVFIVDQSGVLEGILTDGDFRRWLVNTTNWDLNQPVTIAGNKEFLSCQEDTAIEEIESLFSREINFIPIVDKRRRLTAIAINKMQDLIIGKFVIAENQPVFIIAEIGNNHNGSIEMAKELVDKAFEAGADCVKFQMRQMDKMYRKTGEHEGNAGEDLGAEYTLDLLSRFQLPNKQLFEVFDYCKKVGILPLCTPFDEESLALLEGYGLEAYKLASADLTNHDLIKKMAATRKPMICSTGMSSESEILAAVELMKRNGASFALLHCNSTYPAPFKDVNLNYLPHLKKIGGNCQVGYSGHERGYAVPIAAVAKGARIIEKHFTIDRNMEGNDHKISLLPEEFAEMVRSIREVEESLGSGDIRRVTQGEMMNREFLGKSLVAARPVKKGNVILEDDLDVRSPGKGLPPYRRNELVGKRAPRDFETGSFFYLRDLKEETVVAKRYAFKRPFGIPVRYHDFNQAVNSSNLDLVEFHLSYKDMEIDPSKYLDGSYNLDFVVHSPELFAGDHIMDLCSDDAAYRQHSMKELQHVIDITRSLKKYFKTKKPCIIINAGGATQNETMPHSVKQAKYALISEAIRSLDTEGVELIPQTMPPFPWHFGGQRYHNLFMSAEDIADFCQENNSRICLDISHSKLYTNKEHLSFIDFLIQTAPYAAHLHIADAMGVDGEGLQIHEGDIDFKLVANELNRHCPAASFIPEIWQGHKNDCEGFWIALERLENYL
ncbi:TIM barrel protein [Sediminibacterium roseum]|uniref:TIM barrel protein n=1 Tax=Sediminibacterium roseum TaxID=1978412 RepID=A0ABW9ZPN9_9BACT|nr:N-acetylneuraminate synthase family protein [Sediminibacterium roseum]NCI49053.1 TIM barrel protein [Sediminibacterium roseum]